MGFSDITKPLGSLPNILSGKIPGLGGLSTSYGLDTGFHGTLPGVLENKLYGVKNKIEKLIPGLSLGFGFSNTRWPLGAPGGPPSIKGAIQNGLNKVESTIKDFIGIKTTPTSDFPSTVGGKGMAYKQGATANIASYVLSGGDYARPNLYELSIVLAGADVDMLRYVSMSCSVAEIPGVELNVVDLGVGHPMKSHRIESITHGPITLTFQLGSKWDERTFFEQWIDSIYDSKTNSFKYYNDYVGTMLIKQFDRQRNVIAEYKIHDVFPSALGPITLGYEANDEISTFETTLSYKTWERIS